MVGKWAYKSFSYDSVACTASASEILSPKKWCFLPFFARMSLEHEKLAHNTLKPIIFWEGIYLALQNHTVYPWWSSTLSGELGNSNGLYAFMVPQTLFKIQKNCALTWKMKVRFRIRTLFSHRIRSCLSCIFSWPSFCCTV